VQVFQKSLETTPVAAKPLLLVTELVVNATSMRVPAFNVMVQAKNIAAKSSWRHLKLRIIRPFD
jgi:hypothetical protein